MIDLFFKKKNEGVAVIVALLLVGIILAIITTLSVIFSSKIRLAGDSRKSIIALYGADSGIEYCLYINLKNKPIPPLVMSNGALVTYNCSVKPNKSTGTYRGVTRSFEVSY